MYILYAIMQTQLRKNIDAAHTYTNTAKERERERKKKRLNIKSRALDNGNVV